MKVISVSSSAYVDGYKLENGNIVWGKDPDMIFPVYDLYLEKIKE